MALSISDDPVHHFNLIKTFCTMRANRMALEIHAHTRIPMRRKMINALKDRMLESALQAADDDDVTVRVNDVQDAFVGEIKYRTPRMWKFCNTMAIILAMRLSVNDTTMRRGITWRAHMTRVLRQRFFRRVVGANDDNDVNARVSVVHDAVLAEYGCV